MQLIASGSRLAEQVFVVELLQQPAGLIDAHPCQRCRGVGVQVGTRDEPKPAEYPLLIGIQVFIGQVERGAGGQVLRADETEPILCGGKLHGETLCCPGRVVAKVRGRHAYRQRQIPAQPGDLSHRGIRDMHANPGGQASQQFHSLAGGQAVDTDHSCGVRQRGQPAATGDEHEAVSAARQQRPHLLMTSRII